VDKPYHGLKTAPRGFLLSLVCLASLLKVSSGGAAGAGKGYLSFGGFGLRCSAQG
jgi:hypothetical protein